MTQCKNQRQAVVNTVMERSTAGRCVAARPRLEEGRLCSDDRSSFVELGHGVHLGFLTPRLFFYA
jgi:hypothetical protein